MTIAMEHKSKTPEKMIGNKPRSILPELGRSALSTEQTTPPITIFDDKNSLDEQLNNPKPECIKLGLEWAIPLIETWDGERITENISNYTESDHYEIADRIIEKGSGWSVAEYLPNFTGLNHTDIANKLIERGGGKDVAHYLPNFIGIDHNAVANKIIEMRDGWEVAKHLPNFIGLDHTEIANKIIETGYIKCVVTYLSHFTNLPGNKIPQLEEHFSDPNILKSNLFRFVDMPEEILRNLSIRFDIPELTNMPRPRTNDSGEIRQPRSSAIDRWYGELSYAHMEGGFNKATIGHLIRLQIENKVQDNIHDASQWLSTFRIPETSHDITEILNARNSADFDPKYLDDFRATLIDHDAEKQFFVQLLATGQDTRARLRYEGVEREPSVDDKLSGIFKLRPGLRQDLNAKLAIENNVFTNNFYNKILIDDPNLAQKYNEATANSITKRKFFKDILKDNISYATELDQQLKQLLGSIKNEFCNMVLNNSPELLDTLGKKKDKSVENESWFFSPENQLLFRAALESVDGIPFYKRSDFSAQTLFDRAKLMIDDFHQTTAFGRGKEVFSYYLSAADLSNRLDDMRNVVQTGEPAVLGNLGDTVRALTQARTARNNYINDTQSWLMRHTSSTNSRLTKIWSDRPMALACGISDNVKDIELWHNNNALEQMALDLESSGNLQDKFDLSYREVMDEGQKPVRTELMRRLSAIDTIRAMSRLKDWKNKRIEKNIVSILPASSCTVDIKRGNTSKSYKFEVLSKDDPRGFTIGEDTNCCMTIDGESSDCIRAGYTEKNCGFMAVYNTTGTIIAQSFWFINETHPNTLVIDNIEAYGAKDLQSVVEIYRHALKDYLITHAELGITNVHVGTGFSDVDLGTLPTARPVPVLENIDYSDAEVQKLLLEL